MRRFSVSMIVPRATRAALTCTALALAACGGPGAREPSATRDPVCVLVDGQLAAWRGLPAHTVDDLPACLGAPIERTSAAYHGRNVDIDHYQPALGVEVWVYGDVADGKVALIEIRREAPVREERARADLGAPSATYAWTADDRAQAGPAAAFVTRDPELAVDELVYADRGLALAVARRDAQPAIVFRARGFAPATADAYLDALVRVPPAVTP